MRPKIRRRGGPNAYTSLSRNNKPWPMNQPMWSWEDCEHLPGTTGDICRDGADVWGPIA